MKKVVVAIIIVTILTLALPALAGEKYVVNTEKDPINVRKKPQGEVIGTIPKGKVVDVIRVVNYDGKDWAVTEYKGHTVYLYGEYLAKVQSENGKPLKVETGEKASGKTSSIKKSHGVNPYVNLEGAELYQVNTNSAGLNVRKKPSGKADILVRVETDSYLWVIEVCKDGEWAKVMYAPNKTGYVMTKYLIPAEE